MRVNCETVLISAEVKDFFSFLGVDELGLSELTLLPQLLKCHHPHQQLGDRISFHKQTLRKNDFSKLSLSF